MLRHRLSPLTVYLVLVGGSSLLFSLIFTVDIIYHVTVVGLSPLQLVLVGTTLEVSIFFFEVPTGVVADLKSRRLSIVVGYLLTGVAFLIEGTFPFFGTILLAQVCWGLGYTFTSGATEAWIADELGAERVGDAFLQGTQAAQVAALVAIPLSVAVGSLDVRLPIVAGGALMIVLAGFLALTMTEHGFTPTPRGERTTWGMMRQTLADAQSLVRRQPVLLLLLLIGLFYGLYSEGLDRLWTAHMLQSFAAPFGATVDPVVWLGTLRGILAVTALLAVGLVRRHLDVQRSSVLGRALMVMTAAIVAGLVLLGLTRSLWAAAAAWLVVNLLRDVIGPLQTAWYNQRIDDPQVRATLFSVSGQADALGQMAGGPGVGAIGNASLRLALVASGALLSPAIPLYALALKREISSGLPTAPRAPGHA